MVAIRLSEAIENLRTELEHARREGEGKGLQFNVGAIELELEVLVEKEATGSGKINWWIIAGGEIGGSLKGANKQKLKLTLMPADASGQPLRVSRTQQKLPD